MNVTAEKISAVLQETADQPAPRPTLRFEIPHPGLDRKSKTSSARADDRFRNMLRTAALVAKHYHREWPHRWDARAGGTRVVEVDVQLVAYNSRRCGTHTAALIREELGIVQYDEDQPRNEDLWRMPTWSLYHGDIAPTQDKIPQKRDGGDPRIVVTVKAMRTEAAPSWSDRHPPDPELSDEEYDARRLPRSLVHCECGHEIKLHENLACEAIVNVAGDPCPCERFYGVRRAYMETQPERPMERALPRVPSLNEPPSWDEIEDPEEREIAIAREMRGNHAIKGGSSDRRRKEKPKIDSATKDLSYQERIASGW